MNQPMPVSEKGQRIRERNAHLPHSDAVDSAREHALRLLDQRAYACAQIRTKLRTRGYKDAVCDEVVTRLAEVGLLNDSDYAAMMVRSLHTMRGLSRRALAGELSRRGIGTDDAQAALNQIDTEDEYIAALHVARKKARSTQGLSREVRMRRIASQLARKGYSPAVAYGCAREVLAQEPDTTCGEE